jgi:hypothetical protein
MSEFTYGHGKIGLERPPAPLDWEARVPSKLPCTMTWHHVLPFSQLRQCWNTVASHQTDQPWEVYALRTYLRVIGFEKEEVKQLAESIKQGTLSSTNYERLWHRLSWPPWDVIQGPRKRADDPAECFDEYTIGLTPAELNRQRRLKSLWLKMASFNDATEGLVQIDRAQLVFLTNALTLMLANIENVQWPIFFRESMWEMVEVGGKKPDYPGAATWRKRRRSKYTT